jgi:hypothetical protein
VHSKILNTRYMFHRKKKLVAKLNILHLFFQTSDSRRVLNPDGRLTLRGKLKTCSNAKDS